MKPCLLCGELTHGSIGAAGLVWNDICQPCKNTEDAALAFRVKSASQGMKMILCVLGLGELGKGFRSETLSTQDITQRGD